MPLEEFTPGLLMRLLRSELRRAITVASAAATNTAKTWDTTAGKDPDQDVLTDLIAAVDDSGVRPNRILYGDVAWNKRLIAHRAQSTSGGYASAGLTIAVADTGAGMAPEIATQLFQPFVTSKPHGMGVGLSISRTIVEGHGGQIVCEPNPAGGTVFRFTLRAVTKEEFNDAV